VLLRAARVPRLSQPELFDERIDYSYWVVLSDVVAKAFGK
jgi:hypothetical protein